MLKIPFQYLPGVKELFLALLCYILLPNAQAQKKIYKSPKTIQKKTTNEKSIIKYGTASFYAKKFHGRKTANGGTYNSTKLTAACNVLPLNTWIKVTNLRNNKTVIVKINDRLHPKNKRLVDLSREAARQLGYISRGLAHVKIEVLRNFHVGK